jgi:hypothetical protein
MRANLEDYVSGLLGHTENGSDKVEVNHLAIDVINAQDAESVEDMLLNQNPSEFESRLLIKRMGSLAVNQC